MSRFVFVLKNYFLGIKLNLFLILQCCFMLIIINANVSDSFYLGSSAYYLRTVPDNMHFFSGSVKSNVELGNSDEFLEFVSELETYESVSGVGYQFESSAIIKGEERVSMPFIVLNSIMAKIQYPLSSGEWFSSNAEGTVEEIIIGGQISSRYSVGEKVTLLVPKLNDSQIEYEEFNAVIVGKLANPTWIIDLGVSSNKTTYVNMFTSYENIILTNSSTLRDRVNTFRCPLSSIMLELSDSNDVGELSVHGQLVDFKNIEENSIAAFKNSIYEKIPSVSLIFMAIAAGIIGITCIYIERYKKIFKTYFLCGATKFSCMICCIINNIITCLIAILLSIFLCHIPKIQEFFFTRNIFGFPNVLASFIFAFLVIVLTIVAFLFNNEFGNNKEDG